MSEYVEFVQDSEVATIGPTAPSAVPSVAALNGLFGDGALDEVDDILQFKFI